MYSIIVGYGAKNIDKLASASAPLHDLAVRYIGPWYGYLIDLAAISALIAVLLAIHTANFRIFYSLGRDGLLPTRSVAPTTSTARRTSRSSCTRWSRS